ncbi:MAG: hypothetical protein ABSE15_11050 [Candidatus Bathyarchaeia archaeon]
MSFPASKQKMETVTSEEQINIKLTDRLSARLYKDCCPHCMETAPLQKGLVLTLNGKELIEEGLGFGAPVVKYQDKTYFSSSAEISIEKNASTCKVLKKYVLDSVSRKKFWRASYIDDGVYSSLRKTFSKPYLTQKSLSPFFNAVMELRQIAKIKTEFQKVKDRGTVTVTYTIKPTLIDISVDFSDLYLPGCGEILVLNEQGSTVFEEYCDASKLKLFGREIGAWDRVAADWASLVNINEGLSFSLERIQGATLFRGWERTRNRFSWAGLSYSLKPNKRVFNYSVRFGFFGRVSVLKNIF